MNLNLERDTEALVSIGLPDFEGCLADPSIALPLHKYLSGLCSENAFIEEIQPFCHPHSTAEDILCAMDAVLDDIPKSRLEMIVALRNNYKIYLLSNIYDRAWQHAMKQFNAHGYSVEDCFDDVFLSCEMSLAKPDPEIFHAVVRDAGIKPEETLFFDDTKSNIEVAEKLGFQAQLVEMNKLEECLERSLQL